jgi:hypothetical protein
MDFGGRDSDEPAVFGPTRAGTAAPRRLREDQGPSKTIDGGGLKPYLGVNPKYME